MPGRLTACSRHFEIDRRAFNDLRFVSTSVGERWSLKWWTQRNPQKQPEEFKKSTEQSKITNQEFRALSEKERRRSTITSSRSGTNRTKSSVIPDRLMSLSARFDLNAFSTIRIPAGANARLHFSDLSARLKPCPFKTDH